MLASLLNLATLSNGESSTLQIMACHKDDDVYSSWHTLQTPQYESLKDEGEHQTMDGKDGPFAKAFPINPLNVLFAHPHKIKDSKDKGFKSMFLTTSTKVQIQNQNHHSKNLE